MLLALFLAWRDRYTQRVLLRSVADRLGKQPGCEDVRYRPSRRRPRYVVADVDTATFLGRTYPVSTARLEVRFWYPASEEYEYYRINWIEPDRDLMAGFHRDADHPDVGPCHIQIDHCGETIDRRPTSYFDVHPLAVLDKRLRELPVLLAAVEWRDGRPSLPDRLE